MSKLIITDWIEKFGSQYDSMALCDNDLFFQRDINTLFSRANKQDPDKIWYWHEENKMSPGTDLWKKNFHFTRYNVSSENNFGEHEINIGFLISSPTTMSEVFDKVRKLFWTQRIELFRDFKFHDQDLVRIIRSFEPDKFRLFNEGDVLHLCNGGQNLVRQLSPYEFVHSKTRQAPYVIHFAGGAWKAFPSVAATFKVDSDAYFFAEEATKRYDAVRSRSDLDVFAGPSAFTTIENLRNRETARSNWRKLRIGSDKPSLLFFSWLRTGSHRPIFDAIGEFLKTDEFDLATVDGNVSNSDFGPRVEDLPLFLSRLTSTINDDGFGRQFGYPREDVPELQISDAIQSLMTEYKCPERNARAVANAAYLYLRQVLNFYRPDAVLAWGRYLAINRILKQICDAEKIPFASMEMGVLPESVAFDVSGHMGSNWIGRDPKAFNSLPLAEKDLAVAAEYLTHVLESKWSRNLPTITSARDQSRLESLSSSSKKVIVYFGSNDAHSGYTPWDNEGRTFHSPFFRSDTEGLSAIREATQDDSDIELVFKPHPITLARHGIGIEASIGTKVLSQVSLEDAFSVADLVVTNVSQVSYEALIRGIPVLMLGRNQLTGSGATYQYDGASDLNRVVAKACSSGFTAQQKKAFIRHVALLVKYYVFATQSGPGMLRPQGLLAAELRRELLGESTFRGRSVEEASISRNKDYKPEFSIIMPVHNAQPYLEDAISSVLGQSNGDFELICIENGSSDTSLETLQYFASQDGRIKVIVEGYASQTRARNRGVAEANGKYIQFMDSDDKLTKDTLSTLSNSMRETDADFLYFFYKSEFQDNRVDNPRYQSFFSYLPDSRLFRLEEAHKDFFLQYPFPWAKVYKAEVFRDKALYFNERVSNFDDNPQNLLALVSCERVFVLRERLYTFRINPQSLTQSVNPRALGMIDAIADMNTIFTETGSYERFRQSWVAYKLHLVWFGWNRLPSELRKEYWAKVPSLFLPGDREWFRNDSLHSKFPFLTLAQVTLAESALDGKSSQHHVGGAKGFMPRKLANLFRLLSATARALPSAIREPKSLGLKAMFLAKALRDALR